MSKKLIIGSLGLALVVSAFAALGSSAFAATESWHQVTVAAGSEIVLGSTGTGEASLAPTPSSPATGNGGTLTVQSTGNWKLQWQAVDGAKAAVSTTAAAGTNLGTSGFAASGGYSYAGAQTTATTGNTWGAVLAISGSGGSLTSSPAPTLGTALSDIVADGTPTGNIVVTPTYSASTSGALGVDAFYGTIYFVASSRI